jgi:transposase
MTPMTREEKNTPTLFVAFELSASRWKLAFACEMGARPRLRNVEAGDLPKLQEEMAVAKKRLGLAEDAAVQSCYEAGRDGFWLHRWLVGHDIRNAVVDPASIEVDRRRRRRKTDRIDVIKLLNRLIRQSWGEKVWSVVVVPPEQAEDERRVHRERERLIKERAQHQTRIRALLATHGLRLKVLKKQALENLRTWDGGGLPEHLRQELTREFERLELLSKQVKEVELEFKKLSKGNTPAAQATKLLSSVKGIGKVGSQVLSYEFFGWRRFNNRREVGSLAGLTGTPWVSGDMDREQGISKAGNHRVRGVLMELAWTWLRLQPESAVTKWYLERYAGQRSRRRRVGIVAVARRLLVELWRLAQYGVVPEGAILRAA